MNTRFTAAYDSSGFTIKLIEDYRAMFKKRERKVPVKDWVDQSPSNAIDFVAVLNDALANEPTEDLRHISKSAPVSEVEQISTESVRICLLYTSPSPRD